MTDLYGIIYVTVNKVDGRRYIGQHKCKNDNDSYLGSGKILKQAISKYGRENFERFTLYIADTEEELDQKEIEFISAFRATERELYYNINEGGNANRMCGKNNPMYGRKGTLAPSYGRTISEEERKRRSEAVKGDKNPWFGHVYTPEERLKFGSKGEAHWNYGNHWSDEVKQKISKANIGKHFDKRGPKTEEQKRKQSEAMKGRVPNFTPEQKEAHRLRMLEYRHSAESKQKIGDANKNYHISGGRRGAKPVICIETGIVYASGYDAARAIGCGKSSISSCISGSCETVKGFHWRYATPKERTGELVYVS